MMGEFFIGLDLGQAADYTALAILERVPAKPEFVLQGRHLERVPLHTSYPAIVAKVQALANSPQLRGSYKLVADATGVGAPVVDLLKAARLSVVPVMITSGHTVNQDSGVYFVPKRILVSNLQVLMQSGRLKFAERLPEVQTLVKELQTFQVKITDSANDTYGAWREGAHDDLVLATALAAWCAMRPSNRVVSW